MQKSDSKNINNKSSNTSMPQALLPLDLFERYGRTTTCMLRIRKQIIGWVI